MVFRINSHLGYWNPSGDSKNDVCVWHQRHSNIFQNCLDNLSECPFALVRPLPDGNIIVKQPDLDLRVLSVVRDGYKKHSASYFFTKNAF